MYLFNEPAWHGFGKCFISIIPSVCSTLVSSKQQFFVSKQALSPFFNYDHIICTEQLLLP